MVGANSHRPGIQQRLLRRIDAFAVRLQRRRQSDSGHAHHLLTGLRGEEETLFYLQRRGYVVVARRWKTPKLFGDIDLVAWDQDTLCFIEVKTRTNRNIVPAEFAVDAHKQRMLRSMAAVFRNRFPEKLRRSIPVRFDVVSVYLGSANSSLEIEVFPAAFSRD